MLSREYCIKLVIDELKNNRLNYSLNTSIIAENKGRIYVDILVHDLMLGINVYDIFEASPDLNSFVTRNTLQEEVLIARAGGCALVQMLITDFETIIWERLKRHFSQNNERAIVGARDCQLLQALDRPLRKKFLDTYHVQGDCERITNCYALSYNNEIGSLVGFGKSRWHNDSAELIRYCVHPDYAITGGFDRLFKCAINELNTKNIITYCDLNQSFRIDNIYEKQFTLDSITPPDYHYINLKTGTVISRYAVMKHKLVEQGFDQSMTEHEIMLSRGYVRVFGAGSLVYKKELQQ